MSTRHLYPIQHLSRDNKFKEESIIYRPSSNKPKRIILQVIITQYQSQRIHLARKNTPHIYSSFCPFQTMKKQVKTNHTKLSLFLHLHPHPLYTHLCHLIDSAQFALPKCCPAQEKKTRKD